MAYRFLRLAGCMFRDLIECAIPGTRFLIDAENVGSRIGEACAASAPHAKYLHFQNGQKRMLSGYCPVAQPAGKKCTQLVDRNVYTVCSSKMSKR
jgi:hypothetical protein